MAVIDAAAPLQLIGLPDRRPLRAKRSDSPPLAAMRPETSF